MKKILVGAAAFGCISGPSWAGKTEIPDERGARGLAGVERVADDQAVSLKSNARIVYSTRPGGTCTGCGWPQGDCKCSSRRTPNEPVPARIVAKLRMEKKGRGGKTVTVVYGLPHNAAFLKV